MRAHLGITFPTSLLLLAAGCGEDTSAPEPDRLAGDWNATTMEYVSKSSPARVELIGAGGAAVLTLEATGTYRMTVAPAGESPTTTEGTWSLSADVLTVTEAGNPFSWQFDWTLSDGTLRLEGGDVLHDCDGDGTPEESTLNMTLVR